MTPIYKTLPNGEPNPDFPTLLNKEDCKPDLLHAVNERVMLSMCETWENGTVRQEARISAEDYATLLKAATTQRLETFNRDMIEALKEAREFVECDLRHSNREIAAYAHRVVQQIDAALAKETGK